MQVIASSALSKPTHTLITRGIREGKTGQTCYGRAAVAAALFKKGERYVIRSVQAKSQTRFGGVRELEGALSKVFFFCSLEKKDVCDIDTAKEALKDYINVSTHVISIDNIVDATCAYYNIKRADIVGKKKMKNIALARQIAIYLINDILGLPLTSIASYFGKDHTTVMYARDKITSLCKSDALIQAQVNDIRAMIQKK